MAAKLSKFEAVVGSATLYTATKNSLRCTAIKLRTGGVCLYSPVSGLSEEAKDSLIELGDVKYLLAPNTYHNAGLVEYSKAYPKAHLVASESANARLTSKTGLTFKELSSLASALPDGLTLEEPSGLKNGEVWLIESAQIGYIWHVVDAFAGQKHTEGPICDIVKMVKVFPNFGIKDRKVFANEVMRLIETSPPEILLPCHGALIKSPELANQIRNLILELG